MKKDRESCDYCMPNIKEMVPIIGGYMTDEELLKVRDAIEVWGNVLHCGVAKLTCTPLLTTHQQILKNRK
jgi:hypothetical protein